MFLLLCKKTILEQLILILIDNEYLLADIPIYIKLKNLNSKN